jgi:hypothetical protein
MCIAGSFFFTGWYTQPIQAHLRWYERGVSEELRRKQCVLSEFEAVMLIT